MKSKKMNMKSKTVILVIISALLLITATVCWFTMSRLTNLDEFSMLVDSPSSHAVFYEAIDTNRNGIIDGTETYEKIETNDNTIKTSDMIPGKIYFYKVICRNDKDGMNFCFNLNSIFDPDNYSTEVLFTADLKKSSSSSSLLSNSGTLSDLLTEGDNAQVLSGEGFEKGEYELYYTFKLDNTAEKEWESKRLVISDVDVAFFEESVEG